eukprot:TRINITY_DN49_c2_g1_i1.p2 TRINITY_DN49_c2_g1~~TRINITY_DN49_c2_g1_i1.p2  ORF type:complete len:167 (+),score=23.81 TRINITY_DN49_c2_g1_i1:45-503(+)
MAARGVTVKDVSSNDFIAAYAKFLKRSGKIDVPKWADIVKTAPHKELAPYDPDWYFVRAAAIARRLYNRGGTGVGGFRKIFGGRAPNGTKPGHFKRSSGAIIRHILHSLESIKVIEKDGKGGRKITTTGQRDLDRIAGTLINGAKTKTEKKH